MRLYHDRKAMQPYLDFETAMSDHRAISLYHRAMKPQLELFKDAA